MLREVGEVGEAESALESKNRKAIDRPKEGVETVSDSSSDMSSIASGTE